VATFEDLEKEVSRLRAKVNRLGGNAAADNARAVDEIVSTADGDEKLIVSGGGGFSAACAESGVQLCKKLEAQAIRDLKGGSVRSQEALRSFHKRYEKLGNTRRLELINEHDRR
jgi:hypothetical protein